MGLFYSAIQKFPQAEDAYTEALRIKRNLAESDPDVYSNTLALTLYNLGNLYAKMSMIPHAEEKYRESLCIRKERALWIDLAKTYYALSLISKGNLEDAIRLFELGILFSGEKNYRYAHKGGEENMYLTFLESIGDCQRMIGVLEALRDPDTLSLNWDVEELERAKGDKNLQKMIMEELLGKEVTPLIPPFQIPAQMLFLYIQILRDKILYVAVTKETTKIVRDGLQFVDFGKKLAVNLTVQMLGSTFGKDICDIVTGFDNLAAAWACKLPSEIVEMLSEKDIIVFSPDSVVSYFPLEGLILDGEPLCISKTVIRATSMHQLQEIASRTLVADSSLIIGNPWPAVNEDYLVYPYPSRIEIGYLENARKEAEILGENLPNPEILLNKKATADTFLKKLSNHSIIHFAGHGHVGRVLFFSGSMVKVPPEFEPEELSKLRKTWRFSHGDPVYMMDEWDIVTDLDILGTHIQEGSLVFLSACETGQHKYAGGGHFQGLARAFLKSGASNVVSSLFPLYGSPAKDFAVSFYRNLFSGYPVIKALQNTRKEIKEKYVAPIYWLSYIHYGNLEFCNTMTF